MPQTETRPPLPPELTQPPHDFGLERAILGTLLHRVDALDSITGLIDAADFTDPEHGALFTEIEARRAAGLDVSVLTLRGWADAHMTGRGGYLAHVLADSHAIADVAASARVLADCSLRRRALTIRDELTSLAADMSAGVRDRYSAILDHAGELLARSIGGGSGLRSVAALLPTLCAETEEAYKRADGLAGVPFGFTGLDFHIGELVPGNQYVLAGRPSHGKSAFALNIAEAVAAKGLPVAFFSLEMTATELLQRLAAQRTGLAADQVRRGNLTKDEMDRLLVAADGLGDLPLFIDDSSAMTLALLTARVRSFQRARPDLALVVVDHLQIMRPPLVQMTANRNDIVGTLSRGLKELAKELNLPVLTLCQLNRANETRAEKQKHPQLPDLRDSGSIEQDADVVIFIHREAVRLAASSNSEDRAKAFEVQNLADCIIAKNRHGRIAVVPLQFDGPRMRFTDGNAPA